MKPYGISSTPIDLNIKTRTPTDPIELIEEIRKILDLSENPSVTSARLEALRAVSGFNAQKFEEIVKGVSKAQEEGVDRSSYLASQRCLEDMEIDVSEIFPAPLADALKAQADVDKLHISLYVQPLWGALAACIGGSADLQLREGWLEPAILNTVAIAPSGSGKSPAQSKIYSPIKARQAEAEVQYQDDKAERKRQKLAWDGQTKEEKALYVGTDSDPSETPDPVRTKYLYDVAQIEAVLKRQSEQKPGMGTTWLKDELSGLFKSADQYKGGGKGDTIPTLLSLWNGGDVLVDRVEDVKSYTIHKARLSIVGGIHPDRF